MTAILALFLFFQSGPAQNGIQLQASHAGNLCLDVSGASPADGAAIVQWNCHGFSNQLWRADPTGDGYFYLRSKLNGKCLEVPAWSTTPGTAIVQWECNGGQNQQWRFEAVDNHNGYRLIARHSNMCLEIPAWSAQPGVQAAQWTCNGGLNQRWQVIEYLTDWVYPVRKGYKFICCDCNLVHSMDFRLNGKRIEFRVGRDNRTTTALRRGKRKG